MVKNIKGGNRAKGMKRTTNNQNFGLRKKDENEEREQYATVLKINGNNIQVKIESGESLFCNMRKFAHRVGSDRITIGSWVLVGLSEFGQKTNKGESVCDLLEVYNAREKELLRSSVHNVNWERFNNEGITTKDDNGIDEFILFDKHKAEQDEASKKYVSSTLEPQNIIGDWDGNIEDI